MLPKRGSILLDANSLIRISQEKKKERGIIATERCCFALVLKFVHSVSDRCFHAATGSYPGTV